MLKLGTLLDNLKQESNHKEFHYSLRISFNRSFSIEIANVKVNITLKFSIKKTGI